MRSRLRLSVIALVASFALGSLAGCYRGYDVEDKQPPPGYAGGQCNAGQCYDGSMCLAGESVCFDPLDPCKGIYCGGNGTCGVDLDTSLPFCACDPGYANEPYAFFCTPAGP